MTKLISYRTLWLVNFDEAFMLILSSKCNGLLKLISWLNVSFSKSIRVFVIKRI